MANAGILKEDPFLDMSVEDFDAVLAVNLRGVFLVRPWLLAFPFQREGLLQTPLVLPLCIIPASAW